MVKKAIASGLVDVRDCIRSLPRDLIVGDYFTGAATFHQVMDVLVRSFKKSYPREAKGLKASSDWDHLSSNNAKTVC